jgi:YjbE family integral membrane protein
VETLQAVIAIVLIDLTLAGDNALVIGMAARRLPTRERRFAIVLGGFLAVAVRVAATAAVTLLLAIPYLQAIGGIILVVIAYRLVRQEAVGHGDERIGAAVTLRDAVTTIVIADAAMSLDNVLGVGGAAHGNIPLLAFGLALSIPIVLFGSGVVAALLNRFPAAVWLGAIALVWTAADMLLADPALRLDLVSGFVNELSLAVVFLAGVVGLRHRRRLAAVVIRRDRAG